MSNLLAGVADYFLGLGIDDVMRDFDPNEVFGNIPIQFAARQTNHICLVESPNQLFIALQSQSTQKNSP